MLTIKELEEKYADVMNCEAITRFRNWVPKESKWVEPTEEEWAARIAAVAEGMKRLMKDLDDGKFG